MLLIKVSVLVESYDVSWSEINYPVDKSFEGRSSTDVRSFAHGIVIDIGCSTLHILEANLFGLDGPSEELFNLVIYFRF